MQEKLIGECLLKSGDSVKIWKYSQQNQEIEHFNHAKYVKNSWRKSQAGRLWDLVVLKVSVYLFIPCVNCAPPPPETILLFNLYTLDHISQYLLMNKLARKAQKKIQSFSDGLFQLRAEDFSYGPSSTANSKVNNILFYCKRLKHIPYIAYIIMACKISVVCILWGLCNDSLLWLLRCRECIIDKKKLDVIPSHWAN